jgi:hypothetical protein
MAVKKNVAMVTQDFSWNQNSNIESQDQMNAPATLANFQYSTIDPTRFALAPLLELVRLHSAILPGD